MVEITENTPKREMNHQLKDLIGKSVMIKARDHFTIKRFGESIKDPKFRAILESEALFVAIGILLDVKDDYLTVLSSWVVFQEDLKADEIHKIMLNDLVKLNSLSKE
jgi:hypothetical protein